MNNLIKRVLDVCIATSAAIILLPVIVVVSLLIKSKLGSPILFKQVRPGKNGEPFEMIKFRTMLDAVDESGNPLPDSERLTDFGKMLRSTSLDELPELWNVIKGDMSVVGPRPLLMEYLPLYTAEQNKRHDVLPGMTGWAQINGRNAISWDDKFKLDTWYVENRSTLLDFKIMLLTVKKVLQRDDISAEGEATMTKFTGEK